MAYATSNPIKKISQMGDSNSLWYYSDGDAITLIDDANYFLSATGDLNAGDVIIVNSGGANGVVDILIVSAATSSTVTTALLA
jgi:hypothetical protein